MSTPNNENGYTISLEEAIARIENWRAYINNPETQFDTKAFFIPIEDIKGLYEDMLKIEGSIGVRGYLARKEDQNDFLLVAVKESKDPEQGSIDVIDKIYDFTYPCPATCAESSPLYTLEMP